MFGGGAGQIISNPVITGFAAQEGEKMLQKGQEELNKYISIGQLKYYFAVDNNYVTKKLGKKIVLLWQWNKVKVSIILNLISIYIYRPSIISICSKRLGYQI